MADNESKIEYIKARRKFLKQTGRKLPILKKKPIKPASIKPLELSYYSLILKLIEPLFVSIRENLVPAIDEIIHQYSGDTRTDSFTKEKKTDNYSALISEIFKSLRVSSSFGVKEGVVADLVSSMAKRTVAFNGNQYDRVFKSVLGVNPVSSENWLEPKVAAFTDTNINLIKSIPEDYLDSLESMVRATVEQGITSGELKKQILHDISFKPSEKFVKKSGGVGTRKINPRTRARLIARDQIQKFNGSLNELRQKESGVNKYVWRNTFSNSPWKREEHSAREGDIYSWGSPPPDGHPGVAINCNCWAEPVLEEFK